MAQKRTTIADANYFGAFILEEYYGAYSYRFRDRDREGHCRLYFRVSAILRKGLKTWSPREYPPRWGVFGDGTRNEDTDPREQPHG